MSEKKEMILEEREIVKARGFMMLFFVIAGFVVCTLGIIGASFLLERKAMVAGGVLLTLFIIGTIVVSILCGGFKVLNPKEALVLWLYGK